MNQPPAIAAHSGTSKPLFADGPRSTGVALASRTMTMGQSAGRTGRPRRCDRPKRGPPPGRVRRRVATERREIGRREAVIEDLRAALANKLTVPANRPDRPFAPSWFVPSLGMLVYSFKCRRPAGRVQRGSGLESPLRASRVLSGQGDRIPGRVGTRVPPPFPWI